MAKANDQGPRTNDDLMAKANDQRPRTNDVVGRRAERGYILLMLMLFIALLAIFAGAVAPTIALVTSKRLEIS